MTIDAALLNLLAETPTITQVEAAKQLGISRSTLAKHLAALQAEGKVRRVGARRNGRWEVLESSED